MATKEKSKPAGYYHHGDDVRCKACRAALGLPATTKRRTKT